MNDFSRRTFLSASGAATGVNLMSGTKAEAGETMNNVDAALLQEIRQQVQATPLVDTHEHFWEESLRVRSAMGNERSLPAPDFGMLLSHYTDSDLQVSGMPAEAYKKLLRWDVPLDEKWRLFSPWYARCRHTGYQACIRETLRVLFNEEDLREDNYERISNALRQHTVPGFYERLLREKANIEYAQVNCIQLPVFRETEQPGLLAVDLSINSLCVPPKIATLAEFLGAPVTTLSDAHDAIDACFSKYAPRAIAIKSQCAYWRSLDFPQVSHEEAAPLFSRYAKEEPLSDADLLAMQGHLFHYCMEKAAAFNLPVKLHTGYYAGHNGMPLGRVRTNAGDLCPTFQAHRDTRFVLFHIAYPYQDEAIALAKHYTNVYVDMCWAWIINPAASVRFLKEFIMAAPACKLFTFGGDYLPVEMSVGHAAIARKGITRALAELVTEGWLTDSDLPELIHRLLCGNAHEVFDLDRVLKNS